MLPGLPLMRRGLGLDVLRCPRCSNRMKLIATILDRSVARKFLEHIGSTPDESVLPPPARAPPTEQAIVKGPTPIALRLARLRQTLAQR